MKYKVINNEKLMQFQIHEGDSIAYMEYRFYKNKIAFMHTVVPESLKNKGMASAMAAFAFNYANEIKKQVMVYCPFVASYVKRHPEIKLLKSRNFPALSL